MNQKPRVVVLVSGSGSNLQSLIDACDSGKIDAEISSVISNRPEVFALERAANAGIKAFCVDHKAFETREAFEHELATIIDDASPDLIVLAGFMRILTDEFVNKYLGKMLNIHPSLLPKYPGLNTHQRAIDAGDDVHGASVHFVSPVLDGGPIVLRAQVPIFENDNALELAQRVVVQEHMMYPLVVGWFCSGRLKMQDGYAFLDNKRLDEKGYASD
jgi:phosphoribosylglycinamide formyltransferase-1